MPTLTERHEGLAPTVQDYPVLFSRFNVFPDDIESVWIPRTTQFAARHNSHVTDIRTRLLRVNEDYQGALTSIYFVMWIPGTIGGEIYTVESINASARNGKTGSVLGVYDTDRYSDYNECVMVNECFCSSLEEDDSCDFCYNGSTTCRTHDTPHI